MAEYSSTVKRSEEHTSELQSHHDLVCRLLLEKKKKEEETNKGPSAAGKHNQTANAVSLALMMRAYAPFTLRFLLSFVFFFFNDTATTEIYTLSLHDALPIYFFCGPGRSRDQSSQERAANSVRGSQF